ncbi:MAG: helix-turn-helix domain-containing protein [Clostridia bacterium]
MEIMNIKELKKYIGIGESNIRKMVYLHQLPYFCSGVKYLFRKSSIDKWLSQEENKSISKGD